MNLASLVIAEVRDIIHGNCEDPDAAMVRVEGIVKMVMLMERDEKVRESFVWNVTKHVPLLTIDTIRYMSAERLRNNLTAEKKAIVTDDTMGLFIDEINRLRGIIKERSQHE